MWNGNAIYFLSSMMNQTDVSELASVDTMPQEGKAATMVHLAFILKLKHRYFSVRCFPMQGLHSECSH